MSKKQNWWQQQNPLGTKRNYHDIRLRLTSLAASPLKTAELTLLFESSLHKFLEESLVRGEISLRANSRKTLLHPPQQ